MKIRITGPDEHPQHAALREFVEEMHNTGTPAIRRFMRITLERNSAKHQKEIRALEESLSFLERDLQTLREKKAAPTFIYTTRKLGMVKRRPVQNL